MYIFISKLSMDGMLTAIYDVYDFAIKHKELQDSDIQIVPDGNYNYSLFSDYVEITEDSEKANKVVRSIRSKLGEEIFDVCFCALCSAQEDRVDSVFRFLRKAFSVGPGILDYYGDPVVMRVHELVRSMRQETHLLEGFTRFGETIGGVLVAVIHPKSDCIEYLAAHFLDRLNTERFLIYDEGRKRFAFYSPLDGLVFGYGEIPLPGEGLQTLDEYPDLWKAFIKNVTIKERTNPVCQRNHLPMRFRAYMTEFQK